MSPSIDTRFASSTLVAAALALALVGCRSTPAEPAPAGPSRSVAPAPVAPPPVASVGAAAADPKARPAAEDPAAIVIAHLAGDPITLADAMGTFTTSHTGHDLLVQGDSALRELVARVVERRLFLSEAEALGIPETAGIEAATEKLRTDLASALFWRRTVDERATVSDEEIEAFYGTTDMALWLTLLEVKDAARAAELHAAAVAGELDLGRAAQDESIHPSATFGGMVDDVRRGQLAPALEAAAFALKEPGDLTPVVPTEAGFAFARLERRVVNEDRPSREVMFPQIRSVLTNRAKGELRTAAEEDLLARYDARIEAELLVPAIVLEDPDPARVVAVCAGEELDLAELRESLRLDALREAPVEDAEKALVALARDWAVERAVAREVVATDLVHEQEIEASVAAQRRELILQALYFDYVYAGIDPSDADVRAYYDERLEAEFTRPPEVRVAYVVVATLEEAEKVRARVDAGEDFTTIAREHSIDTASAVHGGRIGWVRPSQLIEPVEKVVFALDVGAFAGPVETDQGFFVVHAMDRREAQVVPFDESRRTAQRRLVTELQRKAYAEWVARLKERADFGLDDAGFARAVAWLDARASERLAEKQAAAAAATAAAAEAAGDESAGEPEAGEPLGPPSPVLGAPDQPVAPPAEAGK